MSRLYYQVTVDLGAVPLTDYLSWLSPHVEEMLNLPHFLKAEILTRTHAIGQPTGVVIRYLLCGPESLANYLQGDAQKMRAQLPAHWQGEIKYHRASLTETDL